MSSETATPDRSVDIARVSALLAGDAAAFESLVEEHHAAMLRVARAIVPSMSVAEEVVQETWVAILNGLDRFEVRSSLKTWMFRILVNRARTRAKREGRVLPFAAFGSDDEAPVDADRFDSVGHWNEPPAAWKHSPEQLVEDAELMRQLEAAIETLPERQRVVVLLRDVQGWTSEEVRNAMDLGETNQRVLLHRGRHKVRAALDPYLRGSK